MPKIKLPLLEPEGDKLHIKMNKQVVFSIDKYYNKLNNYEKRMLLNALVIFVNDERLGMWREENPDDPRLIELDNVMSGKAEVN